MDGRIQSMDGIAYMMNGRCRSVHVVVYEDVRLVGTRNTLEQCYCV